jgi:hypothetical protein
MTADVTEPIESKQAGITNRQNGKVHAKPEDLTLLRSWNSFTGLIGEFDDYRTCRLSFYGVPCCYNYVDYRYCSLENKMKLPKKNFKVKIGHRIFKVKWSHEHCMQHNAYGHVLPGKGVMWLDPKIDKGHRIETFLHECRHVFWNITGLSRREGVTEEQVIIEETPFLIQLIEDNPHIFGKFK